MAELNATQHSWCPQFICVQEKISQSQGRKIQLGLISKRDHSWHKLITGVGRHSGETPQYSCPFLIFFLGIRCWPKARSRIWTHGLSLNSYSQSHRSQSVPPYFFLQPQSSSSFYVSSSSVDLRKAHCNFL